MKHYGAVLSGDANVVDGGESSILTIGTASSNNDRIVIHNDNTESGTGDASPLTVNGLVIVPSMVGRGATHILGADGREVAITDVGGGINSNLFVPISTGTEFVNSRISQDITAQTGAATITIGASLNDTTVISGDLQVEGTQTRVDSTTVSTADRFIELGTTGATDTTTGLTGGLVAESSNNGAGTRAYGGLRYSGSGNVWQVSGDTTTGLDGTWADLGVAGAGVQSVVEGPGIDIDATDANNPIASVEVDDAAGHVQLGFDTTGAAGKLRIVDGSIPETKILTEDVAGISGTAAPGVGRVLAFGNATTDAFSWVLPATGTVQKHIFTFSKAAGDVSITIPQSTHTQSAADADLPYTIQVYEAQGAGVNASFSQIIPESIVVAGATQDGTGTDNLNAGDIVITFGMTELALAGRVVIKE